MLTCFDKMLECDRRKDGQNSHGALEIAVPTRNESSGLIQSIELASRILFSPLFSLMPTIF